MATTGHPRLYIENTAATEYTPEYDHNPDYWNLDGGVTYSPETFAFVIPCKKYNGNPQVKTRDYAAIPAGTKLDWEVQVRRVGDNINGTFSAGMLQQYTDGTTTGPRLKSVAAASVPTEWTTWKGTYTTLADTTGIRPQLRIHNITETTDARIEARGFTVTTGGPAYTDYTTSANTIHIERHARKNGLSIGHDYGTATITLPKQAAQNLEAFTYGLNAYIALETGERLYTGRLTNMTQRTRTDKTAKGYTWYDATLYLEDYGSILAKQRRTQHVHTETLTLDQAIPALTDTINPKPVIINKTKTQGSGKAKLGSLMKEGTICEYLDVYTNTANILGSWWIDPYGRLAYISAGFLLESYGINAVGIDDINDIAHARVRGNTWRNVPTVVTIENREAKKTTTGTETTWNASTTTTEYRNEDGIAKYGENRVTIEAIKGGNASATSVDYAIKYALKYDVPRVLSFTLVTYARHTTYDPAAAKHVATLDLATPVGSGSHMDKSANNRIIGITHDITPREMRTTYELA